MCLGFGRALPSGSFDPRVIDASHRIPAHMCSYPYSSVWRAKQAKNINHVLYKKIMKYNDINLAGYPHYHRGSGDRMIASNEELPLVDVRATNYRLVKTAGAPTYLYDFASSDTLSPESRYHRYVKRHDSFGSLQCSGKGQSSAAPGPAYNDDSRYSNTSRSTKSSLPSYYKSRGNHSSQSLLDYMYRTAKHRRKTKSSKRKARSLGGFESHLNPEYINVRPSHSVHQYPLLRRSLNSLDRGKTRYPTHVHFDQEKTKYPTHVHHSHSSLSNYVPSSLGLQDFSQNYGLWPRQDRIKHADLGLHGRHSSRVVNERLYYSYNMNEYSVLDDKMASPGKMIRHPMQTLNQILEYNSLGPSAVIPIEKSCMRYKMR